jgi:putative ABC transport system permease protein
LKEGFMDGVIKDIRFAIRGLLKHPGFTAIAVLTLALGIGANSAIFSVVNAVVFASLPFPEEKQLLRLGEGARGRPLPERGSFSFPDYKDLQSQTQTLAHVAAYLSSGALMNADGVEERIIGAAVAPEYFDVLGVRPQLGRVFTSEENREGSNVVVISHRIWQQRFAGRADVVGQSLKLGASVCTVIGVMPAGFEYPYRVEHQDFWEPLNGRPLAGSDVRDNRSYRVIARMKSGVAIETARAELDAISRRLEQQYPNSNTTVVIGAAGLQDDLTRDSRPALFVLLGAVSFVLLIACANVANFMLARATSRQREIALRMALGASRWRIIRQLLVESLMLSFVGGTLGLVTAVWATRLLIAVGATDIPRVDQVGIDLRVLGFTAALSLLTGIAFGLIPAVQASGGKVSGQLNEGARGSSAGPGKNLARSFLVVSEVALSLILLVGAGLLLKSFVRLVNTDPGFDPAQVATFDIPLSRQSYDTPEKQTLFFERLTESAKSLPGVQAAGLVNNVVMSNSIDVLTFDVAGRPASAPGSTPQAFYTVVTPGYFDAMKIPVRSGRLISDTDRAKSPPVMVVSESLVSRYFPGENPIGLRLVLDPAIPPIEIVGIVGDARRRDLERVAEPEFYVPFAQAPSRRMNLVLRSTTPGSSLITSVRGLLTQLDKDQKIWQARTLDQLVASSVSRRKFNLLLLGSFAGVALLLALFGIYGVMTYSVKQSTKEIGIRMALGAQVSHVLRLVLGNGMLLALIGVGIGLVGSFALTRLMRSLLFEVAPTDVSIYVAVAIGLQLVALIACYIPARRATKVDPLVALRYE